jgi:hypothetical protein
MDFATTPGDPIAAPCTGRVTFSGTLPTGEALSFQCRSFTVTLLGVAGTERGEAHRGATVGRATGTELHLGVRHTRDRFGYIDPAPLLRDPAPPAEGPPPVTAARQPLRPRPRPPAAAPAATPLAPWPAWLGLAMVLGGATRFGLRTARTSSRRRRTAVSARG